MVLRFDVRFETLKGVRVTLTNELISEVIDTVRI